MSPHILVLDVAGAPHRWINVRDAAHYYATDMIAWAIGTNEFVLRGGTQHATGLQSMIRASSIIAIKGRNFMVRQFDRVPTLTKQMLLARDRYICAYCAQRFPFEQLEMEHILPKSKGGAESWMNLVTACKACNQRKSNRTPHIHAETRSTMSASQRPRFNRTPSIARRGSTKAVGWPKFALDRLSLARASSAVSLSTLRMSNSTSIRPVWP